MKDSTGLPNTNETPAVAPRLIPIGFWRQYAEEQSELPWPEEGSLPEDTLRKVALYLRSGRCTAVYIGRSRCRICGKCNGSAECTYDDFLWPDVYAHYFEAHRIMPDPRLLAKVLSMEEGK